MQKIPTDFFQPETFFGKQQLPLRFRDNRQIFQQNNIVIVELQCPLDRGSRHFFKRQMHFECQFRVAGRCGFFRQVSDPVRNR